MKVVSSWFRGTWLVILVAAIVIALDQITKEWVRATIEKYTYIVPIPRLGNYFVLEHVENNGAAFGILQGQNRPLIIVALVVAVAILIYAPRIPQDQWLIRVFLGLQLGGALANVMDRINHGYVTDFVRIGVPGVFYWPSFNVADSAIVVGVIGLGVMIIRDDIRREREAKAAAAPACRRGRLNLRPIARVRPPRNIRMNTYSSCPRKTKATRLDRLAHPNRCRRTAAAKSNAGSAPAM